jgi:hypothetical protein
MHCLLPYYKLGYHKWMKIGSSTSEDYQYVVESAEHRQQRLGKRKQHEETPEEN